jgi:hypothetical protein
MRTRSFRFAFHLVVLHALLLSTACSTTATRQHQVREEILLHVENGQFEPVVVYLVRAGAQLRVGVVEGLTVRTMRLPAAYLSAAAELTLRAESPMPSQTQTTLPFHIEPGQSIQWTVRVTPTLSAFAIR